MRTINQVEAYLNYYPQERERLGLLMEQIGNGLNLSDRTLLPGHITGSAIVIEEASSTKFITSNSESSARILMIWHPFLKKWLQPGGHVEQGETPLDAAKRELTEETGLTSHIHPWHEKHIMPFDIDIHSIPANEKRGELTHFHYDFRYLLCADKARDQQEHQSNWIEFKNVEEPSLIAVINKIEKMGIKNNVLDLKR